MQRLLMAGLLTGLTVVSVPSGTEVASSQAAALPTELRYDVYLTYPEGLRFIYPEGYRVDSATFYRTPEPGSALKRSWEIWKAADYLPFGGRYQEEPTGAEPPPHISLEVFQNPDGKPLQDWMELATSPGQVTTVAGQGAIAYTATGLYESDVVLVNHPSGDVVKLQVGYIDANDPMRQVFQTVVESLSFDRTTATGAVTDIDYGRLEETLMAANWQAANLETIGLLMQLTSSDYFYPHLEQDDITALPCEDLQIIDALWSRYSEGRYGFSAQQSIWRSLAASDTTQAEQFGEQVGWRRSAPIVGPFGDSLWRSDTELTYLADAPAGHLPWPGVSSLTLERMIQDSGAACGTCTIDAMYISSDRFPDLLNVLMPRIEECLCTQNRPAETP